MSPVWLDIARGELGVAEVVGPEHNPRILEYQQTVQYGARDDETPWCSAFVNWCMRRAGLEGTNNAAARSWLNWGVPLAGPRLGCVVVFWRVSPSDWRGHVGFFVAEQGQHALDILGGNQNNSVSIAPYPRSQVLGFRWPAADGRRVEAKERILKLLDEARLLVEKI